MLGQQKAEQEMLRLQKLELEMLGPQETEMEMLEPRKSRAWPGSVASCLCPDHSVIAPPF